LTTGDCTTDQSGQYTPGRMVKRGSVFSMVLEVSTVECGPESIAGTLLQRHGVGSAKVLTLECTPGAILDVDADVELLLSREARGRERRHALSCERIAWEGC
jgi:hypothetical protein